MTEEQIEIIKSVGAYEAVCNKISSALFSARDHLDKATYECMADFDNRVEAAIDLIGDARALYGALPACVPEPADD